MRPATLRTPRLVLDLPVAGDVERVARYGRDPLFERFLTTPWPYTEAHARSFLAEHVPSAWKAGTELTWAIRAASGAPLMGVICLRAERRELGFWLGAEHRGAALMTEATTAVCDWALTGGFPATDSITWQANAGNIASAMVARAAGFRNTTAPDTTVPWRNGVAVPGWSGERGAVVDTGSHESWESILGGAR
jgi:RimJ/RimL family protein N-acetyltransferase